MIIAAMVAGATPDCVTAKLRHGRHFFRKGFERNESLSNSSEQQKRWPNFREAGKMLVFQTEPTVRIFDTCMCFSLKFGRLLGIYTHRNVSKQEII
ncbi:MAG TPA: hypothetical protein VNC39_14280 [Acidocella sp.]|jgi:hypothetical protein|uniref:hypothetical protein n=1 Tax=Acidocella sp. TaxID=50710 RepID=UPI002B6744A4|nr:hypothetical protein [Acidocella sp.]HVE23134.1 hypothetical protein [Acidocella sp.]